MKVRKPIHVVATIWTLKAQITKNIGRAGFHLVEHIYIIK